MPPHISEVRLDDAGQFGAVGAPVSPSATGATSRPVTRAVRWKAASSGRGDLALIWIMVSAPILKAAGHAAAGHDAFSGLGAIDRCGIDPLAAVGQQERHVVLGVGLEHVLDEAFLDGLQHRVDVEGAGMMSGAGLRVGPPLRSQRDTARRLFEPGEFIDVQVAVPFTVAEARGNDPA